MKLPAYVGPSSGVDIPIKVLCNDLQNYAQLPEFHRERVWTLRQQQRLIESLFSGRVLLEIRVRRKGDSYEIIDGYQQIAAIVRFYHDGFSTARAKDDPRQSFSVEPNKRRSQLAEQNKAFFDNLIVRLRYEVEDEHLEEWEVADLYRRLNGHRGLSKVDQLWSYPSQTHDRAKELLDHVFWQTVYTGGSDRTHTFIPTLYLLFIELHEKQADMTNRTMYAFAAGRNDERMNSALVARVRQRLDDICHLFTETCLTRRNEVIPVYQAIQLLHKHGINVQTSRKGCLTPWYQHIQEEFREEEQTFGRVKTLRCFTQQKHQGDFWREHLQSLFETDGLCLLDVRRNFTKEDIRKALERQRHLCASCDKPITAPFDGHHIIAYKEGGPTTEGNCAVLHAECHKDFHAGLKGDLTFFRVGSDME